MAETTSLAHLAFYADEPEFNEIKRLMKDNWLWAFDKTFMFQRKEFIFIQKLSQMEETWKKVSLLRSLKMEIKT